MLQNFLVIGSGIMGSSVSALLACHHFSIVVYIHQTPQDIVKKKIINHIEKIIRKHQFPYKVEDILSHIEFTSTIPERTFDFVFEAVPEIQEVKKQVIRDFHPLVTSSSIWASSTSSLSITDMSTVYAWPERFVGLHFFNPVAVMELVEIIPSMLTAPTTIETVTALTQQLGKKPISVEDSPGFIVNRLLIPMINEAVILLENGVASPEEIDQAMQYGAHHPMGPLALADLIGNDICLSIMETLYKVTCDSKYRPSYLLRKMVSAKKLGRKTGEGFYKYSPKV